MIDGGAAVDDDVEEGTRIMTDIRMVMLGCEHRHCYLADFYSEQPQERMAPQ